MQKNEYDFESMKEDIFLLVLIFFRVFIFIELLRYFAGQSKIPGFFSNTNTLVVPYFEVLREIYVWVRYFIRSILVDRSNCFFQKTRVPH